MNDKDVRKASVNPQIDDSSEDTLRSMISSFYSRKMLSVVILVWVTGLLFFGLAILSAVLFFRTDRTRDQILYAALFVTLMQWCAVIKIFAWQTIHKNSIKRTIRRLEARMAELQDTLQRHPG